MYLISQRSTALWFILQVLVTSALLHGCSKPLDPQSQIDRAVKYQAAGKFRAAMIDLKNVLQQDPENGRARLELGKIYSSTRQSALAEKELHRALELGIPSDEVAVALGTSMLQQRAFDRLLNEIDIDSVSSDQNKAAVLLLRGKAYFALNKDSEAEEAFNNAQQLDAGATIDALTGRVKIAIKNNELDAAEDLVSGVLEIDSTDATAWLSMGIIERMRRNFVKAEKDFIRVTEIESSKGRMNSNLFFARVGLVQVQMSQGKTQEAAKNIEILQKVAPTHPALKYYKALLHYEKGDFEAAVIQLQKILKIDSNNKPTLLLIGAVNFAQGNLEQADMYLSNLLGISPDHLTARKLLAAIRLQLEQPGYALETLQPVFQNGKQDGQFLALIGEAYLKSGEHDKGINSFERAIEADPGNLALQLELVTAYISAGKVDDADDLLGRIERTKAGGGDAYDYQQELQIILAYMKGGNTDSALSHAQVLLSKNPNNPVMHNVTGSIMASVGHNEQALRLFEKAIELQPDYEWALINLGRLEYRQRRMDEAASRYKRVLEINPGNVVALLSLAKLAEEGGNLKQAIEWLEKARRADPAAVNARLLLVRYYVVQRNFALANEIAREAVTAGPLRPDVLNALGATQMLLREYGEAESTFKQVLEIAPESTNVIYNLARAQLSLNDIRSASANLHKALEMAPNHIPAASILAALELREGNTEGALRIVKQQQEENQNNPAAYTLEGDLHLIRGKYADAVRAYRAAWNLGHNREIATKLYVALQRQNTDEPTKPLREWLEDNSDDLRARAVLAEAYQNEGNSKAAMEQYDLIMKSEPENPLILNNLAWLYYRGKDSRAVQVAERAHNISPGVGAITDTFGWILVETGEVDRGIQLLRKAVEQAPDIPKIRYHLAIGLARSGSHEEAKRLINQVIQSESDLQDLPEIVQIMNNTK